MVESLDMQSPVLVREKETSSGQLLGHLTLNKPKALNALDLEMAKIMLDALKSWQNREDVVMVLIDGFGDKAFCAGGDVVSMHQAMKASPDAIPGFLQEFFTVEYELDFTIHTYSKPVVVWGSGIVMGGGMGLLCGASHRVVTPSSRLAMPEITIGLYPDVGGSYFLPRLPGKSGLFLGLTGASLNAADASYVGLADHICDDASRDDAINALLSHNWLTEDDIAGKLNHLLSGFVPAEDEIAPSNVESHQALIDELCHSDLLSDVAQNIRNMKTADDKWLARAQKTFLAGSPITVHLVQQQIKRGADLSLADCFKMELIMSCRCGEVGEFQEGVRALLIDKDGAPSWRFESVEDVPMSLVEHFFASPWASSEHPLSLLGE
ncbi:enoyl-CoA hydratase/isomerase family protein [Alteromonas sp. ASW11-130]|uniref:enoyl-CoA hydratase/isomerase family protein n=1 Tax=Alteromonas sp. ASW11-130 TaxID=3015775 RepID=UPI002241C53C|nr:enoyl-CoA hydratase/isomerase family protein [Alteromonas sp. ASW11-130]MCW8092217.1 enoyl-CoA hydratase/isomerase family protein [Alteromonas sp. ASW11-130]